MSKWTVLEGLAICRKIESISPSYGAHVALTGGLLYRDGPRKDCDILIYRIRQVQSIDWIGLFESLESIGLFLINDYGWCKKCRYFDLDVDIFDAEDDGIYGAYGDFEAVEP